MFAHMRIYYLLQAFVCMFMTFLLKQEETESRNFWSTKFYSYTALWTTWIELPGNACESLKQY